MRLGGVHGRSGRLELACVGLLLAIAAGSLGPAFAGDDDGEPSWGDRMGDKIKDSLGGAASAVGLNKPTPPPPKEAPSGCPTIAIQDGTVAQRVMAAGQTSNAGVRYQFSLYQVGRACEKSGTSMSVKIGADGRVLLGPAGTAGRFEVPIRVVIFSEVDQKPVTSKLYKVPASMTAGQASIPFQFVSDSLPVPIAAGRTGDNYSIKVGIDTGGRGGGDAAPKGAKGRKRQKTAAEAAN